MRIISLLTALAAVPLASGQVSGFNYGGTFQDGRVKFQADFEADFRAAASLNGAPVRFTSARLFTMRQAGTDNDPISAIPAAIATRTSLLLGVWTSGSDVEKELTALRRAIDQYGSSGLRGVITGISVGSEDLYRMSPTAKEKGETNPGLGPGTLAEYIGRVREIIAGGPLAGVPIGHVDTWTEWVNGANRKVVDAVDFLGFDGYPFYETSAAQGNSIEQHKSLFDSALAATRAAAGGKEVWITETGFPVSGASSGSAVPGVANARRYWQEVGCSIFGKMNVWWFRYKDADPVAPAPPALSFGIANSDGSPIFDLSCPAASSPPSPPPPPPSSTPPGSTSRTPSSTPEPTPTTPPGSSTSSSSSPPGGNSGDPTTSSSSMPTTTTLSSISTRGQGIDVGGGSGTSTTQTVNSSATEPATTAGAGGAGPAPPAPSNDGGSNFKTGSVRAAAFAALLGVMLVG